MHGVPGSFLKIFSLHFPPLSLFDFFPATFLPLSFSPCLPCSVFYFDNVKALAVLKVTGNTLSHVELGEFQSPELGTVHYQIKMKCTHILNSSWCCYQVCLVIIITTTNTFEMTSLSQCIHGTQKFAVWLSLVIFHRGGVGGEGVCVCVCVCVCVRESGVGDVRGSRQMGWHRHWLRER